MDNFELNLRNAIVDSAVALNNSGLRFSVFHDSFCNTYYWYRMRNGGFALRDGAIPSEAINDIFSNGNLYGTECATAMMIVYYKALLKVYGDKVFNKVFIQINLMNWHIDEPLLREVGIPTSASEILIGDRRYFINPEVNPRTPEWQGENVLVLRGGLYYGHGIGITTADHIIRSLNSNRRFGATQSAYLLDDVFRPDFKKLADAYAKNL